MPDRDESTAPAVAFPPTIAPEAWEDFPAFRETLLLHYSNPEYNAALRALGAMLYEIALEAIRNPVFPDLPGLFTRHELAAAAGDLRCLQGFLTMAAEGQGDPDDPDDAELLRLTKLAARLAVRVGKIAAAIEGAVRP